MLCIAKNCFVLFFSPSAVQLRELVAGGEIPDTAYACIAIIYLKTKGGTDSNPLPEKTFGKRKKKKKNFLIGHCRRIRLNWQNGKHQERIRIMTKIASDILQLIGNTPLVRLNQLNSTRAEILLKLEFFNPMSSVKDRIGLALIEDAEQSGKLKKGGLIIEPTSGNTGIGLAMAAAVKGYRLILTMPETMSVERRKLLAALGAEIVLTEGSLGMQGSIDKAEEIHAANPGSIIPGQFTNPANPAYHYRVTAEEILRDTDNRVDFFVAGVGTGGTLSGIGKRIKEVNPDAKVVAVEPSDSPILSGGKAGPHKLQGIGTNFIPQILNTKLIDEVVAVDADDAGNTARELAKREGILVGISAGAALFAALKVGAREENAGKRIVVLMPDSGERYLSTWLFSDIV